MIRYFYCTECGEESINPDDVLICSCNHIMYEENPFLLIAHSNSYYNRDWGRTIGKDIFNIFPNLNEENLIKIWIEAIKEYEHVEVTIFYRGIQIYNGSINDTGYFTQKILPIRNKVKEKL